VLFSSGKQIKFENETTNWFSRSGDIGVSRVGWVTDMPECSWWLVDHYLHYQTSIWSAMVDGTLVWLHRPWGPMVYIIIIWSGPNGLHGQIWFCVDLWLNLVVRNVKCRPNGCWIIWNILAVTFVKMNKLWNSH